jgi:four helix bundle protein
MATAKEFEDLKVWQEARQLVRDIYTLSKRRDFLRDAALRDQIRRAATSTMSNIAEGFERGTKKEFVHFLNIAKASNGEVRSQLYIASDLDYVSDAESAPLREASKSLSRRLSSLIRYLEGYPAASRARKPGED